MARRDREERENSDGRMPGSHPVSQALRKSRAYAFYGRSGTGKTTLAASFPKPAILLDVRDEGEDSVADVKGLDIKRIHDFEEFEEAYWWLKKHPKAYKTIIIDTVSQLQQLVLLEVGGKKKRGNRQVGDWGSLTRGDWGDISGIMKEWLTNYRDLKSEGMNIVFIAQDRVFNLGDDEEPIEDDQIAPEVGPALSPAIAKALNASVDVIGNTFIRSKTTREEVRGKKKKTERLEFCLRLGPNSVYVTKVRKPKSVEAPAFIINPTFEDIIEVIKGEG